jgi:hypothetical protein
MGLFELFRKKKSDLYKIQEQVEMQEFLKNNDYRQFTQEPIDTQIGELKSNEFVNTDDKKMFEEDHSIPQMPPETEAKDTRDRLLTTLVIISSSLFVLSIIPNPTGYQTGNFILASDKIVFLVMLVILIVTFAVVFKRLKS